MGVILGPHDASNAPLVGGVRVEAIAPMREKDALVDDADALPVLSPQVIGIPDLRQRLMVRIDRRTRRAASR